MDNFHTIRPSIKTYAKLVLKPNAAVKVPDPYAEVQIEPKILNPEFKESKSLGFPKPRADPLTTRNAIKFLLEGNLKSKVCRYCLKVYPQLTELDQILQVANNGVFYSMTIKEMVASFHPFKTADDPNFPDKICEKCVDKTISSYLFAQQCDQAERALHNCFEDMFEKLEKLDNINAPKKRGRQKLNPNYNTLYAEKEKVIDYAEPVFHLIRSCESMEVGAPINDLECLKCCEVFPNLESLLNHGKTHPKSMWFNCRLCGRSFPKLYQIKKHLRLDHTNKPEPTATEKTFCCETCGIICKNYYEYLQHLEKHKFKNVLKHLVEKKMDRLCSICLNQGGDMTTLDQIICLHGGSSKLYGDKSLISILSYTLPEINILDKITGTKICEKCVTNAVTAYTFINQTYFVRNRLNTVISVMLDDLNKMEETKNNVCIEIALNAIITANKTVDDMLSNNGDDIDESKCNVEILEDEFRIQSDDDNETEEMCDDENVLDEVKPKCNENNAINGYLHNGFDEFLKFKRKSTLPKPKFTCTICSKHFVSDYFLKRHVLKHLPNKTECDICGAIAPSKFSLHEHKRMTHFLNINEFDSCEICGRCFTSYRRLKHHRQRHINKQCQLCNKIFTTQSHYNDHIRRHISKIGLKMRKYIQNCSFCEKDCSNDNEFSLHVNKVHLQIKPYSCDMCEKQFYTDYNLQSHKELHNVSSREKCQFCGKILSSRKNLVIHIRKHIGDKPFCCQICNESFYTQSKVNMHMKYSHGGKYCCRYCRIACYTKNELYEHIGSTHKAQIWLENN